MDTEKKRNVLLVLFEGLPGTVIESQVLLHAKKFGQLGLAEFEIWTIACFGDLYCRSLERRRQAEQLAGVPVRVIRGIRPAIPFSIIMNGLRLWWELRNSGKSFSHIHARSDYGGVIAGLLARLTGAVAVWDCRGDTEAEFIERPRNNSMLMRLATTCRLITLRWTGRLSGRLCHRAIFVSESLRESKLRYLNGKPAEVIPCVAPDDLFFFDPNLRARTREALRYRDEHRVYVYSGSMAHYQCFPETVELFKTLRERNANVRLLVLTPQQEAARTHLSEVPSEFYLIKSVQITEMNAYLNAADYAVMLRKANRTNAAASPTKFAEYCLTGLSVIMTDAVPDSYALAQRFGNLIRYENGHLESITEPNRQEVMQSYQGILTRSSYIEAYRRIYA